MTSYQKKLLLLLTLMQFTVVLDFMILSPLGAILIPHLKITAAQFSTLVSSYAFAAAASGILVSIVIQRFEKKKFLILSYLGFVFGTFGCGESSSFSELLFWRSLTGIFGGIIASQILAIVSHEFEFARRGLAVGFLQLSFVLSQVIGLPLGIFLASKFHWSFAFLTLATFGFVLVLFTPSLLKSRPSNQMTNNVLDEFKKIRSLVLKSSTRNGLLGMSFLMLAAFMILPYVASFCVENLNVSIQRLPLLYVWIGAASLFFAPLAGKLADRIGKFKLFQVASIGAAVLLVMFSRLSQVSEFQIVLVCTLLFGFFTARIVSGVAINTEVSDDFEKESYLALSSSCQQLAGAVGAVLSGAIVTISEDSKVQNFSTLAFVVVFTMLISWIFFRNTLVSVTSQQT